MGQDVFYSHAVRSAQTFRTLKRAVSARLRKRLRRILRKTVMYYRLSPERLRARVFAKSANLRASEISPAPPVGECIQKVPFL